MNLKIFNHEFNVVDVKKIKSNGDVFLFTAQLNTDIFTIDDWVKMQEKLSKNECTIENNIFNFDFRVLLGGINFNHNISRDGIKKLISFDFCIEINGFFDENLFLSVIQETKFRFNKK